LVDCLGLERNNWFGFQIIRYVVSVQGQYYCLTAWNHCRWETCYVQVEQNKETGDRVGKVFVEQTS